MVALQRGQIVHVLWIYATIDASTAVANARAASPFNASSTIFSRAHALASITNTVNTYFVLVHES